jgi:hypothetical protein
VGEIHDAAHLSSFVQQQGCTAVLGVHAFRAGKVLLDSQVPYLIVLGGTDVNVMAEDASKCQVMQQALDKSAAVLAFSREMLSKMRQVVPRPLAPSTPDSPVRVRACFVDIVHASGTPDRLCPLVHAQRASARLATGR